MKDMLNIFLRDAERNILDFLTQSDVLQWAQPLDIKNSILSYVKRPTKRLRPAVLLMACGAIGGEELVEFAIPAAAGVELFHTWTLVHDDLIDNDCLRRGKPTVHEEVAARAREFPLHLDGAMSAEYGRDVAILTGDMQHGWSVVCFAKCAHGGRVKPEIILNIIQRLQSYVLGNLIFGETLDVQYGMTQAIERDGISEDQIERMLWLKTGVLYEFAGWAGALLGLNAVHPEEDPRVAALKKFASHCGTAFQLQDDILGIVGDESVLKKPVGSDIREGKQTVIVHEALLYATEEQKLIIRKTMGNKNATNEDIQRVIALFREHGIDRAKQRARGYIEKALPHLECLQPSKYKDLLRAWAEYMLDREF